MWCLREEPERAAALTPCVSALGASRLSRSLQRSFSGIELLGLHVRGRRRRRGRLRDLLLLLLLLSREHRHCYPVLLKRPAGHHFPPKLRREDGDLKALVFRRGLCCSCCLFVLNNLTDFVSRPQGVNRRIPEFIAVKLS